MQRDHRLSASRAAVNDKRLLRRVSYDLILLFLDRCRDLFHLAAMVLTEFPLKHIIIDPKVCIQHILHLSLSDLKLLLLIDDPLESSLRCLILCRSFLICIVKG